MIQTYEIFRRFEKEIICTSVSPPDKYPSLPRAPYQFKDQLHGSAGVVIDEDSPHDWPEKNGDILLTRLRQTPLLIRTADCGGVFLHDPITKSIAAIHAGWRGTATHVIREAISMMKRHFHTRPENLYAAISPSIGPCCFEFSNPKKELPKFLHTHITEENTFNLWSALEEQLKECGVPIDHIENPRLCTMCRSEFPSYRRDKTEDRIANIIMRS